MKVYAVTKLRRDDDERVPFIIFSLWLDLFLFVSVLNRLLLFNLRTAHSFFRFSIKKIGDEAFSTQQNVGVFQNISGVFFPHAVLSVIHVFFSISIITID